MKLVSQMDLFYLRCAAAELLRRYPENPNAEDIRKALINTNEASK